MAFHVENPGWVLESIQIDRARGALRTEEQRHQRALELDGEMRLLGRADLLCMRVITQGMARLAEKNGFASLGYSCIADYAVQRLGCGGGHGSELAWMGRRLSEEPMVDDALLDGRILLCVDRLLDAYLSTHAKEALESISRHPILERDSWWCTVPNCSRRSMLHTHHIHFQSQGGSDEAHNLTGLCLFHHLQGIHAGRIRLTGSAPHALRWEIGVRPDGAPHMVVVGDRLLRLAG